MYVNNFYFIHYLVWKLRQTHVNNKQNTPKDTLYIKAHLTYVYWLLIQWNTFINNQPVPMLNRQHWTALIHCTCELLGIRLHQSRRADGNYMGCWCKYAACEKEHSWLLAISYVVVLWCLLSWGACSSGSDIFIKLFVMKLKEIQTNQIINSWKS